VVACVTLVLVLLSQHNAALSSLTSQLTGTNSQLNAVNSRLELTLSEAQSARVSALENEKRAHLTVYAYDMRKAFEAAEINDARMVESLLQKYADGTDLSRFRGIEWSYLRLRTQRSSREILQTGQSHYMAKLAPDGKALAVVGQDAFIRLLDWPSGTLSEEWPSEQTEVNGVCFAPDGRRLWTAGDDGTICLWDRATYKRLYGIDAHRPNKAFELIYDAQRQRIVSCGSEGTIRVWDAETGAARGVLVGHQGTVDTIQLHSDGRRLVSQSKDATVRIWDLESLSCERTIDFPVDSRVTYLTLSPDGRLMAACTWGQSAREVQVFDLERDAPPFRRSIANELSRVCFDGRSRTLFVGDMVGSIVEWSLTSEAGGHLAWDATERSWQAHRGEIYHVGCDFTRDELITAGRDGRVIAWGRFTDDLQLQHELHCDGIADFLCVPGQNQLLIASDGDGVQVCDVHETPSDDRRLVLSGNTSASAGWWRVATSPDGELFAAGTQDGRVGVWHRDGSRLFDIVQVFVGRAVHALTFTPDGRHVCASSRATPQAMWIDTATGGVEPLPVSNRCERIEFAPDGSSFTTEYEASLRIADPGSGVVRWQLPYSSALLGRTLLFLPDGKSLVVAKERSLRIYDAFTGRLVHELLGHKGDVNCVAVSGDGRTLASSSSADQTVKLWHVATGQHLTDFPMNGASRLSRCAFSHDDSWLAYILDADHIRLVRLR
ncbi:MAG TPA: hypothetical protein VM165_13835, partial [Planctomycetaceae bacterium]|nr:hypothetical protein [Planctomycetaceae bacterium]